MELTLLGCVRWEKNLGDTQKKSFDIPMYLCQEIRKKSESTERHICCIGFIANQTGL